jgi:shikimate kinase
VTDPPKPDNLILVGMMGAGKTTVGSLLAQRLGRAYFDSDAEVQEATGLSVPALFAARGEGAFRTAESDALQRALGGERAVVVSAAGGSVLSASNRALMARSGTVVWLRARVETLAARVGAGEGRPLLDEGPAEALARLDAERRPLYRSLADIVIDVDDLTADEVADRVQRQLPVPQGAREDVR